MGRKKIRELSNVTNEWSHVISKLHNVRRELSNMMFWKLVSIVPKFKMYGRITQTIE